MNLDKVFKPKSIAVIGASTNPEKLGHQILKKVLKTKNIKVFPVNPKAKKILGLRTYADVSQIQTNIDQAIIVIPANFVSVVLDQVIKKNIKSVIVVTAGFGEFDSKGKKLEAKLKTQIKNSKLAVIGPNCLGYANPQKNLDITFAKTPPPIGNIGLVSQSGAIGSFLFDWAKKEALGFSKFVSLGNRAGINESDLLSYLSKDKQTKVIGLYLESFADGKQFLKTASLAAKLKPVVVLFGGLTELGKTATMSHTAALSPETKIISTAIKQSGCIEAKSLEEFTALLEIFSLEPPLKDNDLVILTNAGGPAILATDQTGVSDLDLVELKDVLGDATTDVFKNTLTNLTNIKTTDAFLIIVSPQTQTDFLMISKNIVKRFKTVKKPVIVSFLGGEVVKTGEDYLHKHGIATITFPKKAVQYFNTLFHYYHDRNKKLPYPVKQSKRGISVKRKHTLTKQGQPASPSQGGLSWQQINKLAKDYKLPLLDTLALSNKNLDQATKKLGFPLVLKSDPSEATHRTEKKALYLNLKSKSAINKAYTQLSKQFSTILAQPQLQEGIEVFIGLKRNKDFPPLLTLGSGGIYTEVYQDTAHAFLPLNKKLLLQLIKQTKIGQILLGVRGQSPMAVDKLIDLILNASYLISDYPEIQNIDINPVIVSNTKASIVDIKINLSNNHH